MGKKWLQKIGCKPFFSYFLVLISMLKLKASIMRNFMATNCINATRLSINICVPTRSFSLDFC